MMRGIARPPMKTMDQDKPEVLMSDDDAILFNQFATLFMRSGPWAFQSIATAAEFKLAEHIGDKPVPVSDLADLTGTHEPTLFRFCRALTALGLLVQHSDRSVSLTPMGKLLRSPAVAGFIGLVDPDSFRAWADAGYTLRTGKPAFSKVFGMSFYEHLGSDPLARKRFSGSMGQVPPPVIEWCGFRNSRLIVDLGGGSGTFLGQAVTCNEQAKGILFDLPTASADAAEGLATMGVDERCTIVTGDFLREVPTGGDTYLLSLILCDWADEDCLRILRNIAAAMDPAGRVIVVDRAAPPPGSASPAVMFDLHMLVMLGGRLRTRHELTALLEEAGFRVAREHVVGDESGETVTPVPVLIEAVRSGS